MKALKDGWQGGGWQAQGKGSMGGKVLIVDDVATNRIVMKAKLTAAGYLPEVAADGGTCLVMAKAGLPDLILLDFALPDMPGAEVLHRLRAEPATRDIPVVVFSASQSAANRIEAFQAGADEFLLKQLDDQTLMARIRSLVRAREAMAGLGSALGQGLAPAPAALPPAGLAEPARSYRPSGTVALILQRPEVALFLRRSLAGRLQDGLVTLSPEDALAGSLQAGPSPDLFIIDADLAIQGGGLRLMSDLRSRTGTREASFAIYCGPDSPMSAAMAFDLGASDLFTPDMPAQELALRLHRLMALKRRADQLRASVRDGLRLAVIDPLTGLHNRRYGLAQMQAIAERARATGAVFAILVADIDNFKSVNDRFGHAAGDAVLAEVAQRLRLNLRAGDLIARIGGEEFLIALPDIALPEARAIAERLCLAMSDRPFQLAREQALPVTMSIGLAISEAGATPAQIETVTDIFDRADRALLRSKTAGRNQVTISRRAA
ncbi:diguanylate cyclase [Tabrizicola oligotrophica]|nr:diguanylate cyclase [Tabrizicola oligotrophica]